MGLSSVMQTALSGMSAATTIVEATSHNVANLQTNGFRQSKVQLTTLPAGRGVAVAGIEADPAPGAVAAEQSDVDLSRQLIDLTLAGNLFRANAAVFRTADAMLSELFFPWRR